MSNLECEMLGSCLSGLGCMSFSPTCGERRKICSSVCCSKRTGMVRQCCGEEGYECIRVALKERVLKLMGCMLGKELGRLLL